jgi:hypothetical protein
MRGPPKLPADAKAAFITLLVLAGGAAALDVGFIGWIVAPICLGLAWFAIFRAPLRNTMLALIFFALVMENPSDGPACGAWSTPFAPAGALLLAHIKASIGGWMFFSGMDLMLVGAAATLFLRSRASRGPIGTPKLMIRLAHVTFATIAFTYLVGLFHGSGQYALWQIDRVMYLPMVFLLCQAAFTSAEDYLAVGKVILASSVIRASQAMYVRAVVPATDDPISGESSLPYTTTHNDSMLFAVGAVMLVALVLQRAGKKYTRLVWLLMPILVGGMVANDRRIVWVEIALVFATLYFMTDTNAFKRKLNRLVIASVPVVIGYIAVGWNSQGGIFKPVQMIRSTVDSSSDGSTAWRDLENFNLVFTTRQFPLFGLGYGHGFWEMWPMPVVPYELERWVPHNSILGLYCYGGFVGYAGITALWVGGVYLAIRSYHYCKAPLEKVAALCALGAILVYYLQCFGDMGLGSWTGVFLVAPSIAVACKLAIKSGAWDPLPVKKEEPAPYVPPATAAPAHGYLPRRR